MLSLKQLEDYCLYDMDHKRCRYLEVDEFDSSKYYCCKKNIRKKDRIDHDIEKFRIKCAKNNLDITQQGVPLGDNCDGFVKLRHKEQGFDQ